jgi:hypothetical protein
MVGDEKGGDVIEVLLRTDPYNGDDPIEADTKLPAIPRNGDMIAVWVDKKAEGHEHWIIGDTEVYLTVEQVVFTSYAPERIEVWVKYDTYDLEELKRVFKAVDRNEQP